jgi:hypothetical protein
VPVWVFAVCSPDFLLLRDSRSCGAGVCGLSTCRSRTAVLRPLLPALRAICSMRFLRIALKLEHQLRKRNAVERPESIGRTNRQSAPCRFSACEGIPPFLSPAGAPHRKNHPFEAFGVSFPPSPHRDARVPGSGVCSSTSLDSQGFSCCATQCAVDNGRIPFLWPVGSWVLNLQDVQSLGFARRERTLFQADADISVPFQLFNDVHPYPSSPCVCPAVHASPLRHCHSWLS